MNINDLMYKLLSDMNYCLHINIKVARVSMSQSNILGLYLNVSYLFYVLLIVLIFRFC